MAAEGFGAPAGPFFNDSSRDGFPSNVGWASVRDTSQSRDANGITTYWGLPCHVCGEMIRLMKVESKTAKKEHGAGPGLRRMQDLLSLWPDHCGECC